MPRTGRTGADVNGAVTFEEVEQAVLETERGRWFLSEHARRIREAETANLMAAIRRLEGALLRTQEDLAARLSEAIGDEDRSPSPRPKASLTQRNMKYFRQDEDIFVEPESVESYLSVVPREEPEAFASIEKSKPSIAEPPPKKRIVIIRQKAEEELSLPC
jgi:hypothetical protein